MTKVKLDTTYNKLNLYLKKQKNEAQKTKIIMKISKT